MNVVAHKTRNLFDAAHSFYGTHQKQRSREQHVFPNHLLHRLFFNARPLPQFKRAQRPDRALALVRVFVAQSEAVLPAKNRRPRHP